MPAMYCSGLTMNRAVSPPSTRLVQPSHDAYAPVRAARNRASPVRPAPPHNHGIVPIQWLKKVAFSGTTRPASSVRAKANSVVSPAPISCATATRPRPATATPGTRLSGRVRASSWRCRPAAKSTSSTQENIVAVWNAMISGTCVASFAVIASASPAAAGS